MIKQKYAVSGFGKVFSYVWMMKRAEQSLKDAKASEKNRMFNSMDTILYSAFAIEAFLNHVGKDILGECWREKDPTLHKLKCIKSKLNITASQGTRPYQSVAHAFKFRNTLAHGKTETVTDTREVWLTEDEAKMYTIDSVWMESSTLENADKICTDIKAVISDIYVISGLGKFPFLSLQTASHTIGLVEK